MLERTTNAGDKTVNQPNVLVISDDAEFSRMVLARWQSERSVPAFTVMSSDLWNGPGIASYDVALVGPVRSGRLSPVLKSLDTPAHPTLCVVEDGSTLQQVRDQHPRALTMRMAEGWADIAVLLGAECIRRVEAQTRARKAEQVAIQNTRFAQLGTYMLDMRHGINNALTSVLGNAELLLMEPGQFTPEVRDQLETIRTMSLRIHEILQRFSSLNNELQFAEKDSQTETKGMSQAAG
ncbi:MAG TPA: histidine kinase dimerization/phospho-acceptor domain-containing protein [Clostridia bacterium]|nr:histidine kinase dimerization/phospho-acceptor domain-containing protein [Clostridia bacterium]